MQGIIIKLLRDLYFVHTERGIIESKARGVFREKNINPIVGDKVRIKINEDGKGYIEEVYERYNELIRPQVANIDLVINIHSINEPQLNTYMLDKGLVMSEFYGIQSIIIFSKSDLYSNEEFTHYKEIYEKCDYPVFKSSISSSNDDIDKIRANIVGKTSVVSGPSGTGKSSLLNRLNEDLKIETSSISEKTKRGRHTTRHIELMPISEDTYILDAPGFSTISLSFIEDEKDLDLYFSEFRKLRNSCKFNDCMHINEPGCKIKEELNNKLSESRYNNYLLFIEEIKNLRRY